jgi:glutamate-5-semialdehyde dehydrogenase
MNQEVMNRTVADMTQAELASLMQKLGEAARAAANILARSTSEKKNAALKAMAADLRRQTAHILNANENDLRAAQAAQLAPSLLDRLKLDETRINAMARGIEDIAELADPTGKILAEWTRPNGLRIARVSLPLGVIGIIYESRPNVTADAGALCLKAGNAAILRGGSESFHSSHAIHACLVAGLKDAGLPPAAIGLVPTTAREAVGMMLTGLNGNIDLIVPRGGKGLVARVQEEARVPVLGHLDGLCHTYVDGEADLDKARRVTLNAKMRRPGICGATETLLIDRRCLDTHLAPILDDLIAAGCEIRGDAEICRRDKRTLPASEEDWATEYLEPILSVKVVDGLSGALEHIARYGTRHTEAIITENKIAAERFLDEVDAGIVIHNSSTQFADGGEFGMGAEIGIATGKLHARGPVGVEQLTIYKYQVRGEGQTRP